jgi:hypothetical protein
MSNFRKNQDPLPAIRLQKQAILPTVADIVQMANEAKRAKKPIELLWQPEGRPDPVVLTIRPNEPPAKSNWILYNHPRSDAIVVWSADDADADRVITAMRDWYSYARATEGWCKDPNMPLPYAPNQAPPPLPLQTGSPAQSAPHMVSPPLPQQNAGLPSAPHPTGEQPYAQPQPSYPLPPGQHPAYPSNGYGAPAALPPPGWNPNVPYSHVPYVNYQYQAYPVPPHWAQYPQPQGYHPGYNSPGLPDGASGSQTAPTQLSPEQWMTQPVIPTAIPALMLGDLLVAAGLIPTQTLQAALTLQNADLNSGSRQKVGDILVNFGAIPRMTLDAAIRLQELARQGYLSPNRTTEILIQVQSSGKSPEEILGLGARSSDTRTTDSINKPMAPQAPMGRVDELLEKESITSESDRHKLKHVIAFLKSSGINGEDGPGKAHLLLGLLKQAGIVKPAAVETANKSTGSIAVIDTITSLLINEEIDGHTFKAGLDCLKLMADNRLKREQAIIALLYSHRSRINLRDAIHEMNWQIPTDDI